MFDKTSAKNISRALLAAVSAGFLVSLMLVPHVDNNTNNTAIETTQPATLKVLQRCNLELPAIQLKRVFASLDEWAPLWLAANSVIPNNEQTNFCTQLLGASLQGPSQDEPIDQEVFDTALDETRQLMITQIADQVLADDAVAEDLAPLMGLAPVDVQHYFKSVKKGSPEKGPGPTPQVGLYFNV